jgi:hypothetical protein
MIYTKKIGHLQDIGFIKMNRAFTTHYSIFISNQHFVNHTPADKSKVFKAGKQIKNCIFA